MGRGPAAEGMVSESEIRRILVLRSGNLPFASRVIRHLRACFGGAEITMMLPVHHAEFFRGGARPDHLYLYDKPHDGALTSAWKIVSELRPRRYDLLVILAPDGMSLARLRSEILLSLLLRAKRRVVIGERLELMALSLSGQIAVCAGWAVSLMALAIAIPATRAVLAIYKPSSERLTSRRRPGHRGARRIAILVPILPDLSHTFVYREVLGMRQNGGAFSLIALERGDPSIIHPEAQALLETAIFPPDLSAVRYLLTYLYFLISGPRRLARLIQLYLPGSHGDALLFLRVEQYQNVCHPMRALALARLLKRLNITHIHAHGSTYPATRAMASSVLLDASFSFSTFVDFDYGTDFKMLHEKVGLAEFVITTTHFCVDRLLSLTSEEYKSKIHTVYLSIDPDYGKDVLPPSSDAATTVLSVSRLVEKKGVEYLLRACAILKERGEAFRCLVVGDGPEKETLRAMVKRLRLNGNVELTGPMSNEKVRGLMNQGGILVAPSIYVGDGERDGIPTVLVEAMACGMAVVSTCVSGIPELVVNEHNGLLVPERDEVALADAMRRLLRDSQLRESLGRRGRQRVLSDFNIRDSSRRLWSLIERASQS